jgi:hypothetical protein
VQRGRTGTRRDRTPLATISLLSRLSRNLGCFIFSTIPVNKVVEKWGVSIFKGLIELILWDIAQFLGNFLYEFWFPAVQIAKALF